MEAESEAVLRSSADKTGGEKRENVTKNRFERRKKKGKNLHPDSEREGPSISFAGDLY